MEVIIASLIGAIATIMAAVLMSRAKDKAFKKEISERSEYFSTFLNIGMNRAYATLSEVDLRDRLAKSRNIRLLMISIPQDEDFQIGLEMAIKQQAKVCILISNPNSIILKHRSVGVHQDPSLSSRLAYQTIKTIHSFWEYAHGANLQVALFDSWAGCPVIWLDDKILMGFYFRGKDSPSWPWIDVSKGSQLAQILDAQFYDLWKDKGTNSLKTFAEIEKWLKVNLSS